MSFLNCISPGGMAFVAQTEPNLDSVYIGGGVMQLRKLNRKILLVVAGLILLVALPATSLAQGRGRGRRLDKKSSVFVNGHDARDGRWDGRGPQIGRRSVISNRIIRPRRLERIRNRDFERDQRLRNRVLRRRGLYNDNFLRSRRLRHRRLERRGFTRRYYERHS